MIVVWCPFLIKSTPHRFMISKDNFLWTQQLSVSPFQRSSGPKKSAAFLDVVDIELLHGGVSTFIYRCSDELCFLSPCSNILDRVMSFFKAVWPRDRRSRASIFFWFMWWHSFIFQWVLKYFYFPSIMTSSAGQITENSCYPYREKSFFVPTKKTTTPHMNPNTTHDHTHAESHTQMHKVKHSHTVKPVCFSQY